MIIDEIINYAETLEVCCRDNINTYSIKIGAVNLINYIDEIYSIDYINDNQYETVKKILLDGNIGYGLFNKISDNEFRIYVAKPNLFGYCIDSDGIIFRSKEYIDNYYIEDETDNKVFYSENPIDSFDKNIYIPSIFEQTPRRSLVSDKNQTYYEFHILPIHLPSNIGISFKEYREDCVANIEIEYNGIIYQGDESSQDRISRKINGLPDDITTVSWKAKDNSSQELTRLDLKEILFLAGQEQTKIWFN